MKQTPIYEVSEILDTFDLEEIVKLLNSQIDYEQNITIYSNPVDHLKPLYVKYRSIMETEDMPEEAKEEAREKFNNICSIFLCMLCKQYDLEIDQNWIDDHVDDIAGVAMSLYSFFVLDLTSNLYEVCSNYINDNTKYIFDVFEEKRNKKDAVTLVNKKSMTIDKAVILSNIYDVSTWILSQITEEDFFDYLNPDYLPLKLIKQLFNEGVISGEFINKINDIYSDNISLKSEVCFRIIQLFNNQK